MGDLLAYDMYNGTVEYSRKKQCLTGKVINIKKNIEYEGETVAELEQDFRNKIDAYFGECEEQGIQPDVPYKGSFNIRISPELHRQIAVYAQEHSKSLNAAVLEAIWKLVNQESRT